MIYWVILCPDHPSLVTFPLSPIPGMFSGPFAKHELSKLQGKGQLKIWDGKPLPAALKIFALVHSSVALYHMFSDMAVSGVYKTNGILYSGNVASMALHLVAVCKTFENPHKLNVQLKTYAGIHSGKAR